VVFVEVFVGTSGWSYDWNRGRSLDWYLGSAGLDAMELNASFYRFPPPARVAGWAVKGRGIRWCVKVHRYITHLHRFNEIGRRSWERFLALFAPLDPLTDWYLFQAPPSLRDTGRLADFFADLPRRDKCVLEIRNRELLLNDTACEKLQEHVPLVSVDSPDAANRIFDGRVVYLRMHGRGDWYRHDYSPQELKETAARVRQSGAEKAYIFFNNDTAMLANARRMKEIFR